LENNELLQKLAAKKMSKAQLRIRVEADFGLVPLLVEGTSSPKASIRYGCGSVLMDLSTKHPAESTPTWTSSPPC
jgi:hypothetical protein